MLKIKPQRISPLAWVVLMTGPFLFVLGVHWYMYQDMQHTIAILEALTKASDAGLTLEPTVKGLALASLDADKGSAFKVMYFLSIAIFVINAVTLMMARNIDDPKSDPASTPAPVEVAQH